LSPCSWFKSIIITFKKVIEINLYGTFNVCRLAAIQMSKQKPINEDGERGVFINVASVAAFEGQIGQSAYSASKGAVVSMALPMARELSRYGIRVLTIAPGIIETPMMKLLPKKSRDSLVKQIPFPSRFGQSSEFADLAFMLIENAYMNGECIRMDGCVRMSSI